MPKYTARTADKHELYQIAVQCPEADVSFIDRVFRRHHGRTPTRFREDFCGAALISCEWARRRLSNEAIGVDLCRRTLDWGIAHNLPRLSPSARRRVRLINDNVLNVTRPKVDVVGAFNFSHFILKDLASLAGYFRKVRASLRRPGLFVLDVYGGSDGQREMRETRSQKGFKYVWEQASYDPISDGTVCHIHFAFPDGTQLKRAFTYDWRLWTLGGLRDALMLAGFRTVEPYWEGTDRKGEGNGVYTRRTRSENSPGWVAYVVAVP